MDFKLNRITEMLEVIQKKLPSQYVSAVVKKLRRYVKGLADLEDILLLEWFIQTAKVEIGLEWKELFWVIEQLGRRKDKLK